MVDRTKMVRTSVIVPVAVLAELQAAAQESDVSVAWVIRHALVDFVKARSGQMPLPLTVTDKGEGRSSHA